MNIDEMLKSVEETTIGRHARVARGLHQLPDERNNNKNEQMKKTFLIQFEDVFDYKYNEESTLNYEKIQKKKPIYVNLEKRYKNSIVQHEDIVLSQRSFYNRPRLIIFNDKKADGNYIYDNSTLFIRRTSKKIDISFLFFILNTNRIRNIINNSTEGKNPRSIICKTVEDIKIELPDLKTQRKIVKELVRNKRFLENLIK